EAVFATPDTAAPPRNPKWSFVVEEETAKLGSGDGDPEIHCDYTWCDGQSGGKSPVVKARGNLQKAFCEGVKPYPPIATGVWRYVD
ncbi:hypothetical protein MMC14_008092, partial [Varicellaria rhodocarpa]|nr:hypothetical protein [Varicellaria rhodocarpa]